MTEPRTPGRLTVAVVVCAYTTDRWADLVAAYESLLDQDRRADEVVFVIDHNPELLGRLQARYPTLRVIANSGPAGLSGGRNTGIAATSSDVVLFLDDDAQAEPGWIASLASNFDDPDVQGVAGWVVPSWDAPGRPGWFPGEFLWVVGCSYRGLPVERTDVRNPIGAAMGFRRRALAESDGFSSAIGRVGTHPVGCEETELAIRLRRADPQARIVLEPTAIARHRVSGSRLTWRYFARRCWWEGVSKAVVTGAVGAGDALASERRYTTRVLPAAVLRGVTDTARGDLDGLRRSAAVVAGLAITALGYLRGRWITTADVAAPPAPVATRVAA